MRENLGGRKIRMRENFGGIKKDLILSLSKDAHR